MMLRHITPIHCDSPVMCDVCHVLWAVSRARPETEQREEQTWAEWRLWHRAEPTLAMVGNASVCQQSVLAMSPPEAHHPDTDSAVWPGIRQSVSLMPAPDSEHSPLCRVISTGAPCHQRAGYKRGITLDLVCLRTRVVFNIGSWLLRDSPLFSRRLECVQSLRQWDWPMWRIADSRSIFYFLPRYCWLWWGQGPRTRCCDHGVRWGPLTQHPGLREEYSLAKIQKATETAKAVCYESKQCNPWWPSRVYNL